MPRAIVILPQVSACPHTRPSQCPNCGCGVLHRHGEVQKRVKDTHASEITAMRYLCVGCKSTFTHYPHRTLTAMAAASG